MTALAGRVALVTGASRGIGAAIAVVLARYGADVAVNYVRAKDRAREICERIQALGRQAHAVQADVADGKAVKAMVAEVQQTIGPIDILVNNAGYNPNHSIMEMSEADWDWVLDLNLKAYFLCSRAVLPDMLEKRDGRIINITSISGQRGGLSCDVDYSSAKAGIMGFTRSLSRWAAPRGVLVNAVAPGYIGTEHLYDIVPSERLAKLVNTVPLKRLGTSEEVGEVVAFLAGPGGDYIVGEVLSVNGGVHIA
jgi:3-oxoacyl-[acyl-carrier protein] reductase